MDFSKNTVSYQRVHRLLDKLSAKNKEHCARFNHVEIEKKDIEQPQSQKIKRLPKMTVAEMISRLRMGKPIKEYKHYNSESSHKNHTPNKNTSAPLNRKHSDESDYQNLAYSQNRDFALNQIMHELSNTRREMIENIIKHNSSNDSIETMIKNKHLIDELTGNNLERPNLSRERRRKRVRKLERSRANSRIYERQRTHVR